MNKKLILKTICFLCFPKVFKLIFQRNRITILYYHDINKEDFEKQVAYLKKNYNIIDLETTVKYLYKQETKIPRYPLLVTFDDGHIGNFSLLDVFKQNKIKPTIFLTSGLIGTTKPFWFKLPFDNITEKERLKKLPDNIRKEILQQETDNYQLLNKTPQALTIEQIQEMSPFVDFQSHTINHPCLPRCSNEIAQQEISESKRMIENYTKKEVYAIAYPNGDYTEREIEIAHNNGYRLGFTANKGFVDSESNPYILNRISMNDTNNFDEFVLRVTGIWALLKKIKM